MQSPTQHAYALQDPSAGPQRTKHVGVVALAVWGLGFNFLHPQHWDLSDARRSEIARREDGFTTSLVLTERGAIEDFDQALGTTWDGVVPLNPMELPDPAYSIKILGESAELKYALHLNGLEWGMSGTTPKRLLKHLEQLFAP